jgi:hypothetical protein
MSQTKKESNAKYRKKHKKQINEWNKEYYENHKMEAKNHNKEYYENHYESHKEQYKEYYNHDRERIYNQTYNISLEEYNSLYESQMGCCAICKKPQSEVKKRFSIDHNHKNGKIRGLLCNSCNLFLGICCDDINILKESINYLLKSE